MKQDSGRVAIRRARIPLYTNGMRIGLLGGLFNPPHAAHRAISLFAIKRLKLDRVWWLVTPGNPLKDTRRPARSRPNAPRPRAQDGQRSAHRCQLSRSCHRYPLHRRHHHLSAPPHSGLRLVWIMGADNLAQFHRWQTGSASPPSADRRDRPPAAELSRAAAPAAQALARYRLPETGGQAGDQQRRPGFS